MHQAIEIIQHTFMITGFVFVMMLLIEYLNVLTSGAWQEKMTGHPWGQYIVAGVLGIIPGCLGAFGVVAMYSHRVISIGAVVTAMIATSGDEAFVMFVMIPKQAFIITGALFILGIGAGIFTDKVLGRRLTQKFLKCDGFEFHPEARCDCFPYGKILSQWKKCIPARGILVVGLAIFILAIVAGQVGPHEWNWMRLSILIVSLMGLFIVSTVPDHFLEDHLWKHIALKHIPRIFLWTCGALVVVHLIIDQLSLSQTVQYGKWIVLVVACLVGLIPESGPHLIFVTLYAKGAVPLSVLLASSIVQDGHGMIPLLAHSRRAFLGIKTINLVFGLLVGIVLMAFGY